MPEDRGDGEPVGDRPYHRGLGAGVHIAEHAVAVAGEQIDEGGKHQQRESERLHTAQAAQSGGIVGTLTHRDRQAGRAVARSHNRSVTTILALRAPAYTLAMSFEEGAGLDTSQVTG